MDVVWISRLSYIHFPNSDCYLGVGWGGVGWDETTKNIIVAFFFPRDMYRAASEEVLILGKMLLSAFY